LILAPEKQHILQYDLSTFGGGQISKRLRFREAFITVPARIIFVIVFIDVTIDLSRVIEKKVAM